MPYVLRLMQRFRLEARAAFMSLEAAFAALEKRRADFPKCRRVQPYAGREPVNTLIWECEFAALAEAERALADCTFSGGVSHGFHWFSSMFSADTQTSNL